MPIDEPDADEFFSGEPLQEQLSADRMNQMSTLVNALKRKVNELEGKIVQLSPVRPILSVPVKQGDAIAGQPGRFAGTIIQPPYLLPNDKSTFASAELGLDTGTEDVELLDLSQCTTDDGTTIRLARIVAEREGGVKIGLIDGGGSGALIPVTLTKTGGSDGTASVACSYVYTVTNAITETVIGTSIAPEHTRAKNKTRPATRGVAWLEGETVHLILTDEIPNFGACTP